MLDLTADVFSFYNKIKYYKIPGNSYAGTTSILVYQYLSGDVCWFESTSNDGCKLCTYQRVGTGVSQLKEERTHTADLKCDIPRTAVPGTIGCKYKYLVFVLEKKYLVCTKHHVVLLCLVPLRAWRCNGVELLMLDSCTRTLVYE